MHNMLAKFDKNKMWNLIAMTTGLLAVVFFCMAYFVKGTNSYVEFHDQLDGEVLNYIYQAKYLFSGENIIPEFMNGMPKSAMALPAPIGVLFYFLLPAFPAFVSMHVFVLSVGYVGTYALINKITKFPIIAILISCVFIYLPFYSVYGLAILGQPMLIYSLWMIYECKEIKFRYYFGVFLYALSSSLALIGYAWVGVLSLTIVICAIMKKDCRRLFAAWGVMVVTYVLTNIDLIKSIFQSTSSQERIHREEMVITPLQDVWKYAKEVFLEGVNYAFSYNLLITILAITIILLYPIIKKGFLKEQISKTYWGMMGIFVLNVVIVILAVLWRIEPTVRVRMSLGGFLKTFQMDRITWMMPICWYILLALCVMLLIQEIKWKHIGCVLAALLLMVQIQVVYENSMIYHNLRLMIYPDTYILLDWDDYYAPDIYRQIDEYIGEDKSTYRTVSLGLPPAAALYNGFYCLDGYSNFYSLEYKHQFRKIIEKELEKQEEVREYFELWGNRCYMFNAETGNFMMIDKNNNNSFKNLDLNVEQLKNMGAKYIFSGLRIDNSDELGLMLAREEAFTTDSSYYKVWLYKITE